jgi:3-phosphoshikimate 1-carboxyvinyltransferase
VREREAAGRVRIEPAAAVQGHIRVPGDKSLSHRAVLLSAISEGESRIAGFGRSADTESTIAAVRDLGVKVYEADAETLRIFGTGLRGLAPPGRPIDCGNAGTLMRLLPGILVGQEGRFELTGDDSLRSRPMERIAEPLRQMGATVETDDGRAPLIVEGGRLRAIEYELPVASAQVKSAVLLAGLYAEGETAVVEPLPTRDHTERLLEQAGAPVRVRAKRITVRQVERLELGELEIPADFSSAAPLLVAATLLSGSELTLHGLNLNPRRTGLLHVLERMGANVTVFNRRRIGGEPAGDLDVRPAQLVGATIEAAEVPLLVDELPLFALLAVHARGDSLLRGDRPHRGGRRRPPPPRSAHPCHGGRLHGARRPGQAPRRLARRPRRPPDRDARRDRRPRLARGRGGRGRGGRGGILPRLLRPPRLAASDHDLVPLP